MADGTLKFDTDIDSSGAQKGLDGFDVAVGNIMTKAIEKIAQVGVEFVKTGAEFESSIAKLSTIADTSAVSTAEFSDQLKELSNRTGVAASDLADVAYNAISAGTSTEDAMGMVETATKLATGGFTDANSALSVLTTAMNAYGDAAGSAEEISDSLIQVQNLGVTTVGDLSKNIGKAIATGSAYSVSLGNIESAYISMTKSGINTAESTTYMSSMMKELGDSGSDVGKILQEKTGKSFGQLMEEGASLGDVLGILEESVGGDAEALMNLWSSAEAGKASNAILNQGLEQFNKNLETVQNSTGATDEAFGTMSDTLKFKAGELSQVSQNLGISFFEGVSGPLGGLADIALEAMNGLYEGLQEGGLEGMFEAGASILENFIMGIAEKVPDLIAQGFDIIGNLVTGILSNLPSLITQGGNILNSFLNVILSKLPSLLSAGGNMLLKVVNGIVQNLPKIIAAAANVVAKLLSTIGQHLPEILQAGITIILKLAAGIVQAVPQLIGKLPSIIGKIKNAFTSVRWGEIGVNIMKGIASGIANGAKAVVNAAKNVAKSAFNAAKNFLGIHSPSRLFRDQVGKQISRGWAIGIEEDDSPVDAIRKAVDDMRAEADKSLSIGTDGAGTIATSTQIEEDEPEPIQINATIHTNVDLDGKRVGKGVTEYVNQNLNEQRKREEKS